MAAKSAGSRAARIGLAIAGGSVLGYGAYYASQATAVSALKRQKGEAETKVFVSQGKFRRAESTIQETDSLIKALQQQTEQGKRGLAEVGQQLAAARQQVQQLEAVQQQKQEEVQRTHQDIERAQAALEQARRDLTQSKQDTTMAEQSLRLLNQQMADAKSRYNPLNHPRVKGMFK